MEIAIRLGLMWQAALSVAMLSRYATGGSSFFLPNIAGAWPYVPQHLLWVGAFVLLCVGRRAMARLVATAAAVLAVVQVLSLAHSGDPANMVATAAAIAALGRPRRRPVGASRS